MAIDGSKFKAVNNHDKNFTDRTGDADPRNCSAHGGNQGLKDLSDALHEFAHNDNEAVICVEMNPEDRWIAAPESSRGMPLLRG